MKPSKTKILIILQIGFLFPAYAQMKEHSTPITKLDAQARLANVETPSTIDALTHEVMKFPHVYQLPSPVASLLEFNLARAETAYRNRLGPGVSESQLLDLARMLEKQFNVPNYSTTTASQIRALRMSLVRLSPSFMGEGLTPPGMKVGDSIQPTMSPLQALHLMGMLIDQKVLNPDYQDPSIDLPTLYKQRLSEARFRAESAPASASHYLSSGSPHSGEMRGVMKAGIQGLSIEEAYELSNRMLGKVGLK